jgi:hypothetical protein
MIERNLSTCAARANPRVALVTCAALPDLEPDERLVIEPLAARGMHAGPVVWDDPGVDWDSYDLVVLRSPWDYVGRRDAFVAWAGRVPRLANPADIVAWNTEKTYLDALAGAGVPVVHTDWVRPGDTWQPPATGEYVVKPAISSGSRDTGLLFFRGEFSHAIRKGPMLDGPDVPASGSRAPGLYRPESITARDPSPAELEVARKVLAAVPGGPDRLLYARVDLIPGPDGTPVLVELELTEPSVFLDRGDGAPERFAAAIATHLSHDHGALVHP